VSTNATTAVYTVTHQGGSTPVVVNQRVNGGQWVVLGSFPFEVSGSGYKVELSDNALGAVAADAIHVVKETVASDAFAWTPAIPATGTYDLYARWTASSANSSAASYTVVHGGGTDVVTVNQKQDGGQWRYLGAYAFEPDAGHQVTLTAAADGAVVADAIRLVGTGPAPADIAYIHADQLGTPQKLTDAAQALVWDRVQDPFGRQASLTAGPGIANDLRFPGQLFDGETGFHYNYFRDYDPSTGRYIQSDPIGLGGGINTFAYVKNSPVRWFDWYGLETEVVIWNPVGTGKSAAGHVSTDINGKNYSHAPGGWDQTYPNAADYEGRQQSFRGGVGYQLDLTPLQEAQLAMCLENSNDPYQLTANNCGGPIQRCLRKVGLDLDFSIFPGSLEDELANAPYTKSVKPYPGPQLPEMPMVP
jgi:RHS repeat-associated protein